jgi:multiple sugar transport system ATP-binding protein
LVRQPAVFLFDEPISSLEEGLRIELRRQICRVLQQLRATAIWVTHDPWEAMSLGDRIAVMGGGRIRQVGAPQHVYDFPCSRFVAGVVGRPAMNFLRGELLEDGSWFRFRGCGVDALIPGDRFCCPRQGLEVELGVRPGQVFVRAGRVACGLPLAADAFAAGCGVVVGEELLGDGWLVRVELGSSGGSLSKVELACRVPRSTRLRRGELVTVGWAPAGVHLFDALSGGSLRRLSSQAG